MVRNIKSLALVFVAAALLATSAPALAQTETDQTPVTTQTTEDTAADTATGREKRLKAYKEKTGAKLTEAQAKRLSSRCKSAQGKIASLQGRINNVVANRKKVYKEIGDKLDVLVEKLVAAQVDTTKLETARADIRVELEVLNKSMEDYEAVLSDLAAMDCQADPDAFQAALLSAREMQATLRAQAQEFRRFATSELRTIIQELRQQLETDQSQPEDTVDPAEGGN